MTKVDKGVVSSHPKQFLNYYHCKKHPKTLSRSFIQKGSDILTF